MGQAFMFVQKFYKLLSSKDVEIDIAITAWRKRKRHSQIQYFYSVNIASVQLQRSGYLVQLKPQKRI